jgi:cytochrome c oxidase cbb3-type subunit III
MLRWQFLISLQIFLLALVSITTLRAQQSAKANPAAIPRDSMLFTSNCGGCHGSDGRGGEHAPDIATAPEVQRLPDQVLIGIVQNGISGAGMPAFGWLGQEKVTAIVEYLRTLQGRRKETTLPGDPRLGEALYFGKAQCSECHMVNGKGGFIGGDLSLYGADASAEQIRNVILDPEKNLPPQKKATTVVTRSGQEFTGMLKVEDNFSVSIQTMDGNFHFFQKSDLVHLNLGSRSLMPNSYRSTLSDQEVNDLVSYLLQVGTANSKHSPGQSSKSDDDDE